MAIHPLVIAELKIRAAQLDLKCLEMDVSYPGEGMGTVSRRHRSRRRTQEVADSYRQLIDRAGNDAWLARLIDCLRAGEAVDFNGAAVPEWAQRIIGACLAEADG